MVTRYRARSFGFSQAAFDQSQITYNSLSCINGVRGRGRRDDTTFEIFTSPIFYWTDSTLNPTNPTIHSSRTSWSSIFHLVLTLYCTVFSGIWLAIAIMRPNYDTLMVQRDPLRPQQPQLYLLYSPRPSK